MNITFLIGNGFDLNLGLNTRYTDFYKYYISKENLGDLAKTIKNNYKLWADLELALGRYTNNVGRAYINDFFDSKARMEKHLSDYLKKESKRVVCTNTHELKKELREKIPGFYLEFNYSEQMEYKNLLGRLNERIDYHIIDFNYTKIIDDFVSLFNAKNEFFSTHIIDTSAKVFGDVLHMPLHIHGDVDHDMILGVNDPSQIHNPFLADYEEFAPLFIKEQLNLSLGEQKTERAKELIDNSRYVAIYGMSIGDTDELWWSYIIEWLLKSENNRLILYTHDNSIIQLSAQEKLRVTNKKKRNIIQRKSRSISEDERIRIYKQTIVVQNPQIFTFNNIEIKEDSLED